MRREKGGKSEGRREKGKNSEESAGSVEIVEGRRERREKCQKNRVKEEKLTEEKEDMKGEG